MSKLKVVELFAGVGGFRIGLEATKKYKVVWSNQWEPSTKAQHASMVYENRFGSKNHSTIDIHDVPTNEIPDCDLLVGGFPCQDYSVATSLKNSKGLEGKKGVTHRIVVYGDPENWGTERERTEDEWSIYRERMNRYTHPNSIDSAMGSIINFSDGDREKNKTARVYDVRVHEPEKFLKAWNKNVKEAKSILGDRRIGLISYEVGGASGATHALVVSGENDNDVQVTLRKIQKTKAFKEYIESRGKVDYIQTFAITTVIRF